MYRVIALLAALCFGAYAVVALVVTQTGGDQDTVHLVGGVLAYAFLAAVGVTALVRWRRARRHREGSGTAR